MTEQYKAIEELTSDYSREQLVELLSGFFGIALYDLTLLERVQEAIDDQKCIPEMKEPMCRCIELIDVVALGLFVHEIN